MTDIKWLVWCHEKDLWWRFAGCGFTPLRSEAGRFTFTEALKIMDQAHQGGLHNRPEETMVPDLADRQTLNKIKQL